jgi:hypothetical protein
VVTRPCHLIAALLASFFSPARIADWPTLSKGGTTRFDRALNAITHEPITVTNDTYITATQVCELLHKLAALNLGVSIALLLDNARYQKCALVKATAASLQIELCFLPAYSPNLNLIERL